jgi:chorismate synthase
MAGNSFGKLFCISTFGESHGKAIGGIIDGCPSNIVVDYDLIKQQLLLRQKDPLHINQRKEPDKVEFLSGIFEGKTTGTPIAFLIYNKDSKSEDYIQQNTILKPSHGQFVYLQKYGIFDYQGSGRASARETASRVVGGCFALMFLNQYNIKIEAFTTQIGQFKVEEPFYLDNLQSANENSLHCPDNEIASQMLSLLKEIAEEKDSIGCKTSCIIENLPIGLGEPVFDKLSADLAKAMLSINAAKGFEYGSGFDSVNKKGSEINDLFTNNFQTKTNFSGGIQAGISNGNPIYFSVAFKPIPSIMQDQSSIDLDGNPTILRATGRHDVCASPRVLPVVEAMAAITIADHLLRFNAYKNDNTRRRK